MYNSTKIAERIKIIANKRGVVLKQMLEDCQLSKNALSSMLSGGSMPKSENLGAIADSLDCSVDYLLGRTDNPDSHKQSVSIGGNVENGGGNVAIGAHNTINAASTNEQETALMDRYRALDPIQKAKLLLYADELLNGK